MVTGCIEEDILTNISNMIFYLDSPRFWLNANIWQVKLCIRINCGLCFVVDDKEFQIWSFLQYLGKGIDVISNNFKLNGYHDNARKEKNYSEPFQNFQSIILWRNSYNK